MKKVLAGVVIVMLIFTGCKAQEITGGNIHIQHREFDKAIEQFKLATEKYPDKAEPYVSLSVAYFMKRNYEKSADALEQAIEKDNKEAKISIKWYENFLGTEDYEWKVFYNGAVKYSGVDDKKALKLAQKAESAEDPKFKSLSYTLHGNILINLQKTDEAIEYYKKAINTDENNVESYNSLARYYLINNESEKAIPYLKKAIQLDPKTTDNYTYLGQAYLDIEDYEKAIKMLEKASTELKDNPKILYNLALSYFKSANYESALKIGNDVLQLEEVDPFMLSKTYNLMGQIHITEKKYQEAVTILNEAIEDNPNNCEAYHLLAIAYLKLNKKVLSSEAAENWDKCLELEE